MSIYCLSSGHFVMVPLNMTYLHCLQHSFIEHLFNLYIKNTFIRTTKQLVQQLH